MSTFHASLSAVVGMVPSKFRCPNANATRMRTATLNVSNLSLSRFLPNGDLGCVDIDDSEAAELRGLNECVSASLREDVEATGAACVPPQLQRFLPDQKVAINLIRMS